MNTSSSFQLDTNSVVAKSAALFELVSRNDIGHLLKELKYDWRSNTLNSDSFVADVLREHGYLEERESSVGVNRVGRLFLSRLLLHFNVASHGNHQFGQLNEKYEHFRVISNGKNSVVVLAKHRILNTEFVLKVVRPGASSDLRASVRTLSQLSSESGIVRPIDLLQFDSVDALGNRVSLDCLVFPFISGITFREFLLQKNHHLNSQIVMAFAEQVGGALYDLERIGAYHGDLHEGNILVDQYVQSGIRFRIVDISFGSMGSLPFEECRNNDLSSFKQHLWRIMTIQRSFLPKMSLRKYIGTRNFLRVMKILAPETETFNQVCQELQSDKLFTQYTHDKEQFISKNFAAPVSFRLQRYEEITDPTIAVRLFVPFPLLMKKISDFSNSYVSGHRGSGKSTYLASLAFFPQADNSHVNFSETFGIYFPCRQGEFRPLSTRSSWDHQIERRVVTKIIVIKIIRRTLEAIGAGVTAGKIIYPGNVNKLRDFVSGFVAPPGIVSVNRELQTDLDNFVSTMIRVELEEARCLSEADFNTSDERDGRTLIQFFEIVRSTFDVLSNTRFHLLFDDAGVPYVPRNVQRVICDLILTSNSIFCVKLSAEKLTYEFQSSDGKILENGQDYFEHDISHILFIGSTPGGLNPDVLQKYFRQIVEQRLRNFSYKSHSITDYLGDDLLSLEKLVSSLARQRKNAYYCGWTTVWKIADRTPRNLLEIVSEIFSAGKIDSESEPRIVIMRDQNRAIRAISEKRLESLSQIPGAIRILGNEVSLGRQLFETTAVIGSVFRKYLRSEAGKPRPRQHLAIERNDFGDLTGEAEDVLKYLITFGVLDSGKIDYARDDEVKKPIYILNRIYCPAFSISYQRDEHLRLSKGKLELLLLDPQKFIREGTKRLRDEPQIAHGDLFDYGEKE